LAGDLFALGIESDAVNVFGVGAGEGHVETASAPAVERTAAEQNAALAGGALECEFEDYVFVAFVEDEPAAAGAGLNGSGDGSVFGAPRGYAEGVPSGEARAVERLDGGGGRLGAKRGEAEERHGGGKNQNVGTFRHGALTFGSARAAQG
jgi:hypothetical protein